MKAYGGVEVKFHSFSTSALEGGGRTASCFGCFKADLHIACRAAKSLECVFPIWFTQCGRVWFTLAMPCPCPCHARTMPFFSRPQHSTAFKRRPCCAVALRRTAWSEHGMASVNRPHCVNKMGKTHSIPLAARHGRGTAWARHAMCTSAFNPRGKSPFTH